VVCIGDDRERVRPELLCGGVQRRLIAAGDDDARALGHEQFRGREPDAAVAARDQRRLVLEPHDRLRSGCIIKPDGLARASGLILQPHKAVIPQPPEGSRRGAMVKRTSLEHADCPIARALDAIGDWWSLLIIRDALLGRRRFGEFQKSLGLAKNILTVRLRALVDRGILAMAPASDGSAYQEYVLTPKGRGLFLVLVALRQWSEEFDETPEEIATILVDRESGRPVRKLELHSRDGRLLSAGDTALKPRSPSSLRANGPARRAAR